MILLTFLLLLVPRDLTLFLQLNMPIFPVFFSLIFSLSFFTHYSTKDARAPFFKIQDISIHVPFIWVFCQEMIDQVDFDVANCVV